MVRLWNKLMTMDQSRLTKRIFLWETNKCNNWVSNIKLLFLECNLENVYSNHEICNTERVSEIFM